MIAIDNLSVHAGAFSFDGLSLTVGTGEYAVLMGKTGSGKTTLLEAVCGLKPIAGGSVFLGDEDVTHKKPAERGVGYVPQDLALFPHLTVRDHLAFALDVRGWAHSDVNRRVSRLTLTSNTGCRSADVSLLNACGSADATYVGNTYGSVMSNRLKGKRIGLMFVGSADQKVRSAIDTALGDAGATVLRTRAITVPVSASSIQRTLAKKPQLASFAIAPLARCVAPSLQSKRSCAASASNVLAVKHSATHALKPSARNTPPRGRFANSVGASERMVRALRTKHSGLKGLPHSQSSG